ncbi:TauD/TfdA family dioxygenase [Actinoplanes sp. NPDC051851]|uniref:TauD/TfdA family dioxygenase n=1 Tax=Actinoplanes sp. NPDC051851 TaxID=3154753 RepID=UPI00342B417C
MGAVSELTHEYALSDQEMKSLTRLAQRMVSNPRGALGLDEFSPNDVPAELRRQLLAFSENSSRGFYLVRGIDIDTVPSTPERHGDAALAGHRTTGILATFAELLGSLIGYAEEKNGALVHEVYPVRGEEQRIENSGSVAFDFHTENVHHPLRPDFLGLLCLRQDHAAVAATRVASVREAAAYLTAEQIVTLRRPAFRSLYPLSFTRGSTGERPAYGPHPVLFGAEDRLFMRFNSHNTQATDAAGRAALRALTEALEQVVHEVILRPGELVVVDNHVAAHGRSAFTPRYDGEDRWLRRFYSIRAVPRWAEQMMPQPRVLPTLTDMHGVL